MKKNNGLLYRFMEETKEIGKRTNFSAEHWKKWQILEYRPNRRHAEGINNG
jgi:hypothetical protein